MEVRERNQEVGPIFEVVRSTFEKNGEWPSRQYVQAVLDQDYYVDLDETLAAAPPDHLRTSGTQRDAKVILTLRGLYASGADAEVERFVEALRWCVDVVLGFRPSHPGKSEDVRLTSDQFADEWRSRGHDVSALDLAKLLEMIKTEGIFDSLSGEGAQWSMTLSYDRLRRFRDVETVADYLRLTEPLQSPIQPAPQLPALPAMIDVRVATASQLDSRVADLDPMVREACGQLLESGHFAHGVQEAAKAMRDLIREVSNLPDDGDILAGKAFSTPNPAIRLADLSNETGQSIQRGVMLLTQGVFAAIRNPIAHERVDLDLTEALEMLAVVNFVVRAVNARPHGS